jgi:hypothetical protein
MRVRLVVEALRIRKRDEEPVVAKNVVAVAVMKLELVAKKLVDVALVVDALTAAKRVAVALVSTVDEARSVPFIESVEAAAR